MNENILEENENIINTNINKENNEILDEDKDNEDKDKILKNPKLDFDMIRPGCLPELDKKIEEYKKAENIIDESNLKIELMEKQINFINKYIGKII